MKQVGLGEWVVDRMNAKQRRVLHYWFTIIWFSVGSVLWITLRNDLWFVGFMSLYAIWMTHLAGCGRQSMTYLTPESSGRGRLMHAHVRP